jgi:hypothetical protein
MREYADLYDGKDASNIEPPTGFVMKQGQYPPSPPCFSTNLPRFGGVFPCHWTEAARAPRGQANYKHRSTWRQTARHH